jgi:transcriptional regulator with GAF, ATPase, and Fis domain
MILGGGAAIDDERWFAVTPDRSGDGAPRTPIAISATLQDVERDHILRTLEATRWRIEGDGGAAARLGINPSTLRGRMRKLGVRKTR